MDLTALLQLIRVSDLHIIFPSFSIGVAARSPISRRWVSRPGARLGLLFEFWLTIFGGVFALGVVSGTRKES
jgi:cytochrome bd-type quinol oxidase subunit 1